MRVTRTSAERFSVVTDTPLADGSLRADYAMALTAGALRSAIEPGSIRVGGLMTVTLGPVSLPRVKSLAVGESIDLPVAGSRAGE